MLESIITISLAGLLAGFIFAMPIGGPISILITSHALKGKLRFSILVAAGASVADFIYVFVAVFGLTKLYSFYKPAIPFLFAVGSVFFIYLGYRIIITKTDVGNLENLEDKSHLTEKIQQKGKGSFFTGFMINFLNPTLLIGVLTSSFFVISLIGSMGFHTGGLQDKINLNVHEISSIEAGKADSLNIISIDRFKNFPRFRNRDSGQDPTLYPPYFHFIISLCYAVFISLGSIIWLYLFSLMIVRFRHRIDKKIISAFIKGTGALLCIFGLFFAFLSFKLIFHIN